MPRHNIFHNLHSITCGQHIVHSRVLGTVLDYQIGQVLGLGNQVLGLGLGFDTQVLGLGLESLVLGLGFGLAGQVLVNITGYRLTKESVTK